MRLSEIQHAGLSSVGSQCASQALGETEAQIPPSLELRVLEEPCPSVFSCMWARFADLVAHKIWVPTRLPPHPLGNYYSAVGIIQLAGGRRCGGIWL